MIDSVEKVILSASTEYIRKSNRILFNIPSSTFVTRPFLSPRKKVVHIIQSSTQDHKMKFINIALPIYFGLFVCLVSLVQAGGDKSAKTTVITLAGGDKGGQGYPIPIPIPICSNGRAFGGGFGRRR